MISAVQAVAAVKRIPEEWHIKTFFSIYDLWQYYGLGDPESECETCLGYDGKVFSGDQLRHVFPDLIIEGPDDIYPNVHMTLWGKDTCKCKLIRVNLDKVNVENLDFYLEW